MEHADKGPDDVFRVGVLPKSTAVDCALDQMEEGAVDEGTRALDEAHGATCNGLHGGQNEPLVGHVIDEQKHPRPQGFERRHRRGEALSSRSQLLDVVTVDSFDEIVAGGKVPIEGAWADACLAGDVVERSVGPMQREGVPGNLQDAPAVALRIGAGFAKGRRW